MMRCLSILLFLALGLSGASAEAARLYKWVDDSGRVIYRDRPPADGTNYDYEQKDIYVNDADADDNLNLSMAARKHPITLYTANKCGSCDLARNYLKGMKIPFDEKNVEGKKELLDELEHLAGALRVPVIKVGDRLVKGFSEKWLETELQQAGYIKKPETPEASQ